MVLCNSVVVEIVKDFSLSFCEPLVGEFSVKNDRLCMDYLCGGGGTDVNEDYSCRFTEKEIDDYLDRLIHEELIARKHVRSSLNTTQEANGILKDNDTSFVLSEEEIDDYLDQLIAAELNINI